MGQLDGLVGLVTGGNGGIGLGMATGIAAAGADIAIWGRDAEKNERAAKELRGTGRRVHTEVCDVRDENQVQASFAATLDAFGKVDIAVANAGFTGPAPKFVDLTLDDWRAVLAVNLDGAFLTLREAARHLVTRGEGGALIAVSSTSAIHGAPRKQPYAAAKTAILGLVRSLAVELAPSRIRVNAVLPGWTDTEMMAPAKGWERFVNNTVGRTPAGRWADPSEFAAVGAYLADPKLTFHTGDALVVDGAYTIY